MNATQRRDAATARHRRFLETVTGLTFDQRFLDPVHGLVFRSIQWVEHPDDCALVVLDSRINDPKDFAA